MGPSRAFPIRVSHDRTYKLVAKFFAVSAICKENGSICKEFCKVKCVANKGLTASVKYYFTLTLSFNLFSHKN
jgi:hypothetical protein